MAKRTNMRLFALLAILSVGPLVAAPVPKEVKKTAMMDGIWEMTERHFSGIRDDSMSPIRWTINGESLVIEHQGKDGFRRIAGSTYRLVKPEVGLANAMDYVQTSDDKDIPPSIFRSLVELNGDTLKICLPNAEQNRPIECKPSLRAAYYVFKRVKEEKDN